MEKFKEKHDMLLEIFNTMNYEELEETSILLKDYTYQYQISKLKPYNKYHVEINGTNILINGHEAKSDINVDDRFKLIISKTDEGDYMIEVREDESNYDNNVKTVSVIANRISGYTTSFYYYQNLIIDIYIVPINFYF